MTSLKNIFGVSKVEHNTVKASCLRDKNSLDSIPQRPGYYKWWADRAALQIILDRLDMRFEDINSQLEKQGDRFCIYVGVAIKESVRARLDWHINQKHAYVPVKCGALSTLRQTISSIVGSSMADENATNEFIDKLSVEYFLSDHAIKSAEAFDEIHTIERQLLSSRRLYILNIQDNKHALAPTKQLRELRKQAKIKALNNYF